MQHINQAINLQKPTGLKQQPCAQQSQVVLHQSPQAKEQLTTILYQCFQSLKVYGKEPEAFDAMVAMHMMVLSDYEFDDIQEAFKFYLKNNNEFPSPSDIAQIIERNGKPPFDKSVYVSISKKPAENRTSEEWQYMRDYEQFITTGDY